MSNLVYVFLNSQFNSNVSDKKTYSYPCLPDYYLKTIEYNSKNFNNSYFLLQQSEIDKIKNRVPSNINLISIEESVLCTDEFKVILQLLESLWPRYKNEVFLYHAFMRLIILGIFVEKNNLENVVHLEADNLVYSNNLAQFSSVFNEGEFGYSVVSPFVAAPGILYFRDSKAGNNFINRIVKLLIKGEAAIKQATGVHFDYITDMNFLDVIARGQKFFKLLPSLPFGEQSQNFDQFNMLFDPASYGQFLGGTNNGHPQGYTEPAHFIGSQIISKQIEVVFDKKPFVIYEGKQVPLYNLHLHNKQVIEKFLHE